MWREVSVCGNIFSVRGTRSAQERGRAVSPFLSDFQDDELIPFIYVTYQKL